MKTLPHRAFLLVLMIAAILTATAASHGVIIVASDVSSNAAYAGPAWPNGSNGGFGFSPWVIQNTGGNAGRFMDTAAGNDSGGPVVPYIDVPAVGGNSFGMFANSGDRVSAYRGFDFNGDSILDPLQYGSVVRWKMDNGGVDEAGSSVGLSLRSGNASGDATDGTLFSGRRFGFEFDQGSANYKIIDAAGVVDTGIGWRRTGLGLDFTLTGPDTFSLQVTDIASGSVLSNYTGTLGGTAGSFINSMALYDRFAGTTADRNLYFNQFEVDVVPEPSTVVLLLGGLGLIGASWRRLRA